MVRFLLASLFQVARDPSGSGALRIPQTDACLLGGVAEAASSAAHTSGD